jgi:alkanesulfonate monooxygenase SsuD/methylene tetrahydromethanopterin reductase-like flavin-dependent oxidoreductase (luciferase family)
MQALWTQAEPEFHGKFVDFDRAWQEPKPLQQPHPPILMGGDGATTWDRVIEFCDGWLPISRHGVLPANLKHIGELRKRAEAAGRDPKALNVTLFATPPNREAIDEAEADGADRVVFSLPCRAPAEVLPVLDEYAKLVR